MKVHLDRLLLTRTAARTRRCHTKMVIYSQGVGEHTFNALAILDFVAPNCSKELWKSVLYHDVPEAITGDVPAPAKWRFDVLENALKSVERVIRTEYDIDNDLTEEDRKLLKFVDIMELVFYGIEEFRMGNKGIEDMVAAALGAVKTRRLHDISERASYLFAFAELTFESMGGNTRWEEQR